MPSILTQSTAVADGSTPRPLQGSVYEYLPFAALLEFGSYADTGDTFQLTVFSGSDVLMQSSTMPQLATATPILYPEHMYLQDVASAGERISVQAVNGSGGAADFRTLVRITPL